MLPFLHYYGIRLQKIELYGTDEWIGISGLLVEHIKVLVYENILIPYEKWYNMKQAYSSTVYEVN